jgi:hypothetical protein
MATGSQQPKERDGALTTLNVAIEALNLLKEISSVTPAKAVVGAVGVLLAMIRVNLFLFRIYELLIHTFIQDSMVNDQDYVELGLSCAILCRVLDGGMDGRKLKDLNLRFGSCRRHSTLSYIALS